MADNKTLLVIFTTTGTFKSFEDVYKSTKEKGCTVLVVSAEYNPSLVNSCDNLFWLSKYNQSDELLPHEKTRTVFFIFIEEVIQRLRQL
jgi:DNA-binding MurR/RpiR family transcriptional regulator